MQFLKAVSEVMLERISKGNPAEFLDTGEVLEGITVEISEGIEFFEEIAESEEVMTLLQVFS